jgi:SAM-dependent methyltransferase
VGVPVDPTNAEALRAWDGNDGACWAEHENRFDTSLARYHDYLLDAAKITTADRVLDIGCGNGHATRDAARRAGSGSALGVDLSSAMIELARRRAAEQDIANVAFEQADAQIHPFDAQAFDAAISRMGTMWFGNPSAAFTNIARALRPGGWLTMLVWQSLAENEWIREFRHALAVGRTLPTPPVGAPGPLSLADPDRVRTILSDAGFSDITLTSRTTPTSSCGASGSPKACSRVWAKAIVSGHSTRCGQRSPRTRPTRVCSTRRRPGSSPPADPEESGSCEPRPRREQDVAGHLHLPAVLGQLLVDVDERAALRAATWEHGVFGTNRSPGCGVRVEDGNVRFESATGFPRTRD